jgi:hypothetical protein
LSAFALDVILDLTFKGYTLLFALNLKLYFFI